MLFKEAQRGALCLPVKTLQSPPGASWVSLPNFSATESSLGELTPVCGAGNLGLNMERQGTEGPSLLPQSTGCFRDQLWIPAASGQLCPDPAGSLNIAIYFVAFWDKK